MRSGSSEPNSVNEFTSILEDLLARLAPMACEKNSLHTFALFRRSVRHAMIDLSPLSSLRSPAKV